MHPTHPLDLGFFEFPTFSPPPDPVGPLVGVGVQTGGGGLLTKVCSQCGVVLPLCRYPKWASKTGKLTHASCCPQCKRKQIDAWETRNPDRVRQHRKKYNARLRGNTDEQRLEILWKQQHKKDIDSLNWAIASEKRRIRRAIATLGEAVRVERARIKARERDQRSAEHPASKARAKYAACPHTKAKQREAKHRRKASLLVATIDGSAPAKYKELLSTATSCHWCATPITASTMEIDHYHPLSRGGLHVASNLVASCARCNRQRRDMTADEYAQWKEKRLGCAKAAAA
jgi:5-methylcytosine-specific restriction endonuclease McrA